MDTLSIGSLLIAAFAGVLAFFSPCMLPILPGLLSVLGVTERRHDEAEGTEVVKQSKGWLLIALMFVLGLSLAFTALGVGVGAAAELLAPYISTVTYLLGFGLILFGVIAIAIETGWIARIPGVRGLLQEFGMKRLLEQKSRNFVAPARAFVIGAGFGLAWTPCVGPYLGAIMTYAVSTEDMWGTTALFAAFSVGMSLSFLIAAAGAAKLFAKFGRVARIVAIGSAVVLILLGFMFLLGFSDDVSRWLLRWVPDIGVLFGNIVS